MTIHHVSVINRADIHRKMFQRLAANNQSHLISLNRGVYDSSQPNLHVHTPSNLKHSSQSVLSGHIRRSSGRKIRLFAVLIGINTYSQSGFPSLRGAVNDAHRFREYLETHLAVPSKHITMLTESQATRSGIIKAFQNLEADERIDKGDAILVYFAGHGTQMNAPAWMNSGPEGHIQAIVPYDFPSVQPIPDCTLGALLSRIADKKGDNITVIFDCCHSASGTRGSLTSDPSLLVRGGALPSPEFPADLDQEILNTGTRGVYVPSKYAMYGLASHTLLAACSAHQSAAEYRGEGRFSSSLLTLLRQVSPEDLRYCDIFNDSRFPAISDRGQTPQCEGLNLDRVLFNGKVQCFRRKQFPIRYDRNKRLYIVEAGDIHRITLATTFEIYQKSDIKYSSAIGILEAKKVEPFVAQAVPIGQPVIDPEQPLIAVVSGPSQAVDLRIRIPQNDDFLNVWRGLRNDEPDLRKISVVGSSSAPVHLVVESTRENQVRFTIRVNNGLPGVPGVPTSSVQYIPNDPTDLHRMFSRAIDFFGGLEHGSADSGLGFDPLKNIDVKLRQLKQELTDELSTTLIPVGPNLCENNIINVPVIDEDSTAYGLDITNKSSADLYVNVFYFDPNTLQIQSVITPYVGYLEEADVPLKQTSGTLTIGYGPGGAPPLSFTTEKSTEVGFLKFYLSTRPVNLSYLVQDYSVQESQYTWRGMTQKKRDPKTKEFWTSIVIPVILRKQQAGN